MRCPICTAAGVRHTVWPLQTITTSLGEGVRTFWDEDDRQHTHDGTVSQTTYACSAGHAWVAPAPRRPCPTCGVIG